MPSKKRSSIRRQPIQERSRKRRQRIVDAARDLLGEYDFTEITMNAIAAKARVPAPAIYRYFSDKEAILVVIVSDTLSTERSVLDQVEEAYLHKVDWRTFFDHLQDAIAPLPGTRLPFKFWYATYLSPEARKVSDAYGQELAERFVRFFQAYGSKWPRKRLFELARSIIEVYNAMSIRMESQTPRYARLIGSWRKTLVMTLVEQALPEA